MGDIDKQRGLAIRVDKHINHIPILAKSKYAPWITNKYRRPAWNYYITILLPVFGHYVFHPNRTDGRKMRGRGWKHYRWVEGGQTGYCKICFEWRLPRVATKCNDGLYECLVLPNVN